VRSSVANLEELSELPHGLCIIKSMEGHSLSDRCASENWADVVAQTGDVM
jgi:hypothetical protein